MVIADAGFWVALLNRNDRDHVRASSVFGNLGERLVSTWPVMTEACHLLLKYLGTEAQERFVQFYAGGGLELFDLHESHVPRVVSLLRDYADLPMDLADASLVVLAEHLGSGRILSTDQRDFRTYRWKNRRPFQNLLLP